MYKNDRKTCQHLNVTPLSWTRDYCRDCGATIRTEDNVVMR